jgi:hypothetical protein
MTSTHFDRFLRESLLTGRESDAGLGKDELYGLYTSWCLINQATPEPARSLWAALKEHRINPKHNHLTMTGPAATDYILASAPNLT